MDGTCIIVEDQPPAQRVLEKYIADLGNLQLLAVYSDAIKALEFMKSESVDIIFLDIHLPKLSGIEFLKLSNLQSRPKVILTTAFSEYAIEGYELDVVDYLLKPFSFERFIKAVTKATAMLRSEKVVSESNATLSSSEGSSKSTKNIFIKSGGEYLNIYLDQIDYINSDGDYTMVYLKDKKHLVAHPLRYWLEILPEDQFCQIHKSYIVNIQAISKVTGGQVFLSEVTLPVGRTFKEGFAKRYLV